MTYDLRSSSCPLFLGGGSPPTLPQNIPVSASVAAHTHTHTSLSGVALDSTEENLGLEVPYVPGAVSHP